MNIYVGNLPYNVRDEELRATFEPYGTVVSAEVIFDKRTRRSRGYGFVEMTVDAEGQRAIAALNGSELYGRELRVDASQPKSDKPEPGSREGGSERDNRGRSPRSGNNERSNPSPTAPESAAGIKGFFKRLFG